MKKSQSEKLSHDLLRKINGGSPTVLMSDNLEKDRIKLSEIKKTLDSYGISLFKN